MQQIKIFKGIESELSELENRVNGWLKQSGARVIQMTGNIAPQSGVKEPSSLGRAYTPSDIVVIVLYEQA